MRKADIEALKVTCPLCKAKPYSPCTYVAPNYIPVWTDWLSAKNKEIYERIGKPTQIVHNERLRKVYLQQKAQKKAEEIARLRDWLLTYGDIFNMKG